mgnify:CR=1 FL=1
MVGIRFIWNQRNLFAYCIIWILVKSIDKDKPYQATGRLVNGTSRYVMLYHKSTGITERIPLDGMVVSISSVDE